MHEPKADRVPVIPEMDAMLAAYDRQDPDPGVVSLIRQLIEERRFFLVGWIRQGVLVRTVNDRQWQRLELALAPFPDIPIQSADHVAAARLTTDLRQRGLSIQAAQSLLWIMAERIGARILTRQQRWLTLTHHGAPVMGW